MTTGAGHGVWWRSRGWWRRTTAAAQTLVGGRGQHCQLHVSYACFIDAALEFLL